jgi:hypothetical protein
MKSNVAEKGNVVELSRTEAAPKTLRELGLPGELASSFEEAFRLLGATRGDRIVGFSFVDVNGNRHGLRPEVTASPAVVRAA